MIPGPDRIVACPHCDAAGREYTLLSGNTFGSERWTDGLFDAPMLPSNPPLVVCDACEQVFWSDEAPWVGMVDGWFSEDDAVPWRSAKVLRAASLDACYAYIDAIETRGLLVSETRERQVRLLAWWADNDLRRSRQVYPKAPPVAPPALRFFRNLERLAALLPETEPGERLFKAEILREQRRFGEALMILNTTFPSELREAAETIRALAKSGDAVVRAI